MKKLLAQTLLALSLIAPLSGHGTVNDPLSRVYNIYLEGPDSPDSDAAIAATAHAGASSYYTWNQVSQNVPDYADPIYNTSYQSSTTGSTIIPDGQLASGANVGPSGLNFSGLDLVSPAWDWPATNMTAGPYTINWLATAPHDPSFFRVWITKEGWDHKSQLDWADLDFLGKIDVQSGSNPSGYFKDGLNYKVPVTLPTRTGRHVLYVAWQRIDPVGEVFFSASDIAFDGSGTLGEGGGGNTGTSDPDVSIADLTTSEAAGTANLTVTLSQAVPSGETATVDYATADVTATAGSDYTATSGTLTFNAGESQKTIPLTLLNDSDQESHELFLVELTNLSGLDPADTTSQVTITDDDTPVLGGYDWSTRDDWGSGYNGWLTIVNSSASPITNGTLILTAPSSPQQQSLVIWGGPTVIDNGDGSYTLNNVNIPANGSIQLDTGFGNASGGSRGPSIVTLNGSTLPALPALPPAVTIADLTAPEGDSSGTAQLNITLARAHTSSIQVAYTTVPGSAEAEIDYTTSSGSVEFTAGQTTHSLTIPILGDTVPEENETFSIVLSGVSGQSPPRFNDLADSQAAVTLQDDDGPINFTATGGLVTEGDTGSTNLTCRLFLSRPVKNGETVSIDYQAHGHGATAGDDFTPISGTHLFPAGATDGTIDIPILGDTVDERLELLMLHFSQPVGINLITTEVVGQIIDNEFESDFGKQRVVAYLDATSGSLNIPPAERVTHIMYAFANVNADGTLALAAGASSQLQQLTALKTQNPALKVLLSVGGWTWSGNFSSVAADPAKRSTFAISCVQAVDTHSLDGIDVDWEWPGVPGGPGTSPTPQDSQNYTHLIHALRTALDNHGSTETPEKHYEISAFTAASPAGIAELELASLANLFDFVNAQGYDLHGPWNGRTGHNAGLFDNSADPGDDLLNIDSVLEQYLAGGFKRHQLLVGAPFFARRFYDVGESSNGLFQASSSTGDAPLYRDITSLTETTPRHWDARAKVPSLYDPNSKTWISYDDPQAMSEKAAYSRNQGFGGIYYWRNGGDTADGQLLTTISDSIVDVDSDADGIDDAWELEHFGDLTTANGTSDFDGDGQNDLAESISLTDPGDSTHFLRASVVSWDATGTTVEFQSATGRSYQLQTSTTMNGPASWTKVMDAHEGTDGTLSIKDTQSPPSDPERFYRLEVAR